MKSGHQFKAIIGITIATLVMGCAKTKTSKSSSFSQASTLALTSTSLGLAPNAQATITATGGTGDYTSYNASTGSMQIIGKGQYAFTAPPAATGIVAAVITVTDSVGTTGSISIAIAGVTSDILSMYSSASPIPVGGSVTLSVVGGTGPYTWQITAGGGVLASNVGSSVPYNAPAAAGTVTVLVTDSSGASLFANIPISGQTQATCNGNFAMNAYGNTGTLFLVPAAGGGLSGSLNYRGSVFTLTGMCTTNGITFTLNDGTVFTGSFYYTTFDPYVASMVGTFTGGKTWVAVPQR